MSHIILIRMNSGDLWTIEDLDENKVTEFDTFEDAENWIHNSALVNQEWEIIEVDI